MGRFWLAAYAPQLAAVDARRMPPLDVVGRAVGARYEVVPLRIPHDCVDGVTEAYYGRPEAFLDAGVRRAQSAWTHLPPGAQDAAAARLRSALDDGSWAVRHGHLRRQPEYVGSWTLVVGLP